MTFVPVEDRLLVVELSLHIGKQVNDSKRVVR